MAILAGCSTADKPRVNLFANTDYITTQPGDSVAGVTTHTNGLWLSRPAVERLQKADILP